MEESRRAQRFVELYARSQRKLYAFVRAQVRGPADADDILQQTSTVLWRKFDQFEPGTDFARWACRVARLEILAHHRNRARLLSFMSNEVLEAISEEMTRIADTVDERHAALADCLEELPARRRDLIRRRYQAEASVKRIARELGRSESAVYKMLQRIHDTLLSCIEGKLVGGEPK